MYKRMKDGELSKDDARIYKRVGDTYNLIQEGW